MAQTKVWAANLGTTVRHNRSTGANTGQGQARRWYVGRHGSYDYDSFVRFALNWSGVGKIVKAVLTIYTDDGGGEMPSTTTEHPHIQVRRLMDAFTEGNAPDGDWQTNDYTTAVGTTTRYASPLLTRAELGVNNIDITGIVEHWAPSTVKQRNGSPGGKTPNYGLGLFGTADPDENIGLISDKWPDTTLRPYITLTYELGPTAPDAPSNMTPSGSVASLTTFEGDFTDADPSDTLKTTDINIFDAEHTFSTIGVSNTVSHINHGLANGAIIYFTRLVGGVGLSLFTRYYVVQRTATTFKVSRTLGGAEVDVTTQYTDGGWSKLLHTGTYIASRAEIDADRFSLVPPTGNLRPNTTYRWRARNNDQEAQVGAFSSLVSFSFQNTQPNAPTLTPASGSSFANPDSVLFRGTFSDPNAGDQMLAYEVQMSAYPEGDARWEDDEFRLWNTGKRYVTLSPVVNPFETPYGGTDLAAGTYYWRARVYDQKHSASNWTYASITFADSFEADPAEASTAIQLRPRAPWRIVIKGMGALRGPGTTVAVIEDAKNVGASELYNSPGELHFTLPKDHAQISAIEPKLTHYSVQFRQGDGWHEVFAGLMDDFDASDTDVIFYGVDYMGLLDRIADERYDASNPDKPSEKGGSKYVTTGKNSINYIVTDQLTRAKALANSPVGFITVGSIATMTETLTVYSTYAPVLQFITGLLDSHRAGTGKRTRLRARRTSAGGYEWTVTDNPGQARDNLRMRYGELVQGYRLVAFGDDWSTRVLGIGRRKDGVKVMYDQRSAPGLSEVTWGRFSRIVLIDGVSDANDLKRRIQQSATAGGKLGKQIGLGLRSGILQPKDGYDIADYFPIDIEDGSVSTSALGSGYWNCVGITWECAAKDGKQATTLTFQPREDSASPDPDLLTMVGISTQAEWQIGWTTPNPLNATSRYWYDMSTGKVYERDLGDELVASITGTV